MSSFGSLLTRSIVIGMALLALVSVEPQHLVFAQSSDEVQDAIDKHNQKIQDLENEIAGYQKQLNVIGTQKQTLQSAIKSIDVSRQQTTTQVKVTENRIGATDLELSQIRRDIATKEDLIDLNLDTVAKSLRDLNVATDANIIEQMLAADTFTEAWTDIDHTASLSDALREQVDILTGAKRELSGKQLTAQQTREKLASLQEELRTQQKALDASKQAKNTLLDQTKSQESTYQALIATKRAEQASFEAALFQLSSQLSGTVSPGAVPAVGSGVLAWPLKSVTITQQFGRTSDSGRLYASGTHDGIDFAAPVGTPVLAALSGTVMEINQGAVQNCQYGKWVLVKHANGLTTLYAHLSQISVSKGQAVSTGQAVGYSGMTGYATGPHLHFTVYSSQTVTLKQYTCKSGYTVTIPIAPPTGYLNPSSYL